MKKTTILLAALCVAAFVQGQERMQLSLVECRQLALEQNEELKKAGEIADKMEKACSNK